MMTRERLLWVWIVILLVLVLEMHVVSLLRDRITAARIKDLENSVEELRGLVDEYRATSAEGASAQGSGDYIIEVGGEEE